MIVEARCGRWRQSLCLLLGAAASSCLSGGFDFVFGGIFVLVVALPGIKHFYAVEGQDRMYLSPRIADTNFLCSSPPLCGEQQIKKVHIVLSSTVSTDLDGRSHT